MGPAAGGESDAVTSQGQAACLRRAGTGAATEDSCPLRDHASVPAMEDAPRNSTPGSGRIGMPWHAWVGGKHAVRALGQAAALGPFAPRKAGE